MNIQVIDSYDQHVEDCSPQWPVSYGVFEEVALSIMDADAIQKCKFICHVPVQQTITALSHAENGTAQS